MENAGKVNGPRWWPIIGGFALGIIILAIVAAASAWQSSIHRSDLDEMESHSATASLLREVGEEAQAAATLLQSYVETGDDTMIPEIQTHATAAVDSLTGAVAQGGVADVDGIAVEGVGLAEGAGQIIALRQSGDVLAAAAALETTVPAFEEFTLGLEEAVALELDEVSALQSSADRADDLASWLLIATLAIGATLALAAAALIARAIISRRVSKEASPI